MDVIITSNERPLRLMATLGSLLCQSHEAGWRVILADNSEQGLLRHKPIDKALCALRVAGWSVDVAETPGQTISTVKGRAISLGSSSCLTLLDADTVFTRGDTLMALADAMARYDIAAASPLARDASTERAVLANDAYLYNEETPDAWGVAEGLTALGLCLCMRRSDLEEETNNWCWDFPYLEDQILVHFLKKRRGYAHLVEHFVLHLGMEEGTAYTFDNQEVVAFLRRKASEMPRFAELLSLREAGLDGACTRRELRRIAIGTSSEPLKGVVPLGSEVRSSRPHR